MWKFISDESDNPFSFTDDKTIAAVIDFIKSEEIYIGTADELADKIKTGVRHHVLAKKLSQNELALKEIGITVQKSRTGKTRELTLMYEPPAGDGNDSNDGNHDSGSVSDLPSQPSLLSQTGVGC